MSKKLFLELNLKSGEIYAGLILGENGEPDYHLVLLEAKPDKKLKWDEAVAWAKSTGGELPTRREQSLLFANCKAQFEPQWYWSNAQYSSDPDSAWMQGFGSGGQGLSHKSYEYRARAVRRLSIIE